MKESSFLVSFLVICSAALFAFSPVVRLALPEGGGSPVFVSSPNGKKVAFAAQKNAKIVSLLAPQAQRSAALVVKQGPVFALTFSPDGEKLVGSDYAGNVYLWDVSAAAPRELWSTNTKNYFTTGLSFIASGQEIVAAGADGSLRVLRAADGSTLSSFQLSSNPITHFRFYSSNLVAVSTDYVFSLWDLKSRRARYSITADALTGQKGAKILDLAAIPQMQSIAVSLSGGWLMFLSYPSMAVEKTYSLTSNVTHISVSGSRRLIVAAGAQHIYIWPFSGNRLLDQAAVAPDNAITGASLSQSLFYTVGGGALTAWPIAASQSSVYPISGIPVSFSHPGEQSSLLLGVLSQAFQQKSEVQVRSLNDFHLESRLTFSEGDVEHIESSYSGRSFAVSLGSNGSQILARSARGGYERLKSFPSAGALYYVPGNKAAVTLSKDKKSARLVDLATGWPLSKAVQFPAPIVSAFSIGKGIFGIVENTGSLSLYDLSVGKKMFHHADSVVVQSAVYDPTQKKLYMVVPSKQAIRVWDLGSPSHPTQQRALTFPQIPSAVLPLDNLKLLAVGMKEGGLFLQHADGSVSHLYGHSGAVKALYYNSAQRKLYSAGADQMVRIWDLSPSSLKSLNAQSALRARLVAMGAPASGMRPATSLTSAITSAAPAQSLPPSSGLIPTPDTPATPVPSSSAGGTSGPIVTPDVPASPQSGPTEPATPAPSSSAGGTSGPIVTPNVPASTQPGPTAPAAVAAPDVPASPQSEPAAPAASKPAGN